MSDEIQPKAGDVCNLPDGSAGTLQDDGNGNLTCVATPPVEPPAEPQPVPPTPPGEEATVKAGDTCTCPDGRTGTVHSYDEGLICIPNADQG
jgi:hypothetical protein